MLALASMGSFSDAHETLDIPIIAANLQRLILPRQSQIWAVLHAADSMERLAYSLAAGFLGRLCLSGELDRLNEAQWALTQDALRFYAQVAPVIKHGRSRLYPAAGRAWRYPQGAQAVVRVSEDGRQALVVAHSFAKPLPAELALALPGEGWQVTGLFPAFAPLPSLSGGHLHLPALGEFEGRVYLLAASGALRRVG